MKGFLALQRQARDPITESRADIYQPTVKCDLYVYIFPRMMARCGPCFGINLVKAIGATQDYSISTYK